MRDQLLMVRLSPEERQLVRGAAALKGTNDSAFVRQASLDEARDTLAGKSEGPTRDEA